MLGEEFDYHRKIYTSKNDKKILQAPNKNIDTFFPSVCLNNGHTIKQAPHGKRICKWNLTLELGSGKCTGILQEHLALTVSKQYVP